MKEKTKTDEIFNVRIYQNGSNEIIRKIKCDSTTSISYIRNILEQNKLLNKDGNIFSITGRILADRLTFNDFENTPFLFFAKCGEEYDDGNKMNNYKIIDKLGEGGFGSVMLALDRINRREVAIKFIKVPKEDDRNYSKQSIKKEMNLLTKLDHPCIIKLWDSFMLEGSLVLVMEYAGGGELKSYINKKKYLDENESRYIFNQLISAVKYCHSHGIIHRDLKLENVLFSQLNRLDIRIVDFGVAGICEGEISEKSKAGSLKYMAPEVLTGEYTEASPSLDMWSMGCILYAMLCGNLPFGGGDTQEIKIAIKEVNFKFPAVPQLSYHCRKFIKGMLCLDPTRRLLTHALREHPWMNHHKLGKSPVTKAAKNILIDQPKVKLRSLTNRKEGGENTKNIGAKSPCGPPLLKLVGPGNYSSLQVKSTKWKAKTPGKGSIFSPNPIKHLNSPIYSPTLKYSTLHDILDPNRLSKFQSFFPSPVKYDKYDKYERSSPQFQSTVSSIPYKIEENHLEQICLPDIERKSKIERYRASEEFTFTGISGMQSGPSNIKHKNSSKKAKTSKIKKHKRNKLLDGLQGKTMEEYLGLPPRTIKNYSQRNPKIK